MCLSSSIEDRSFLWSLRIFSWPAVLSQRVVAGVVSDGKNWIRMSTQGEGRLVDQNVVAFTLWLRPDVQIVVFGCRDNQIVILASKTERVTTNTKSPIMECPWAERRTCPASTAAAPLLKDGMQMTDKKVVIKLHHCYAINTSMIK